MTSIAPVPENQSLPLNMFDVDTVPALNAAYEQCLDSERNAATKQDCIYARCLGYFLIELPDNGKLQVADDIILCDHDRDKMNRLAELYINHIIRLFRQNKGNTPAPSHHPSRPSFDNDSYFLAGKIEPAPQDHRAAKRAALKRDNYKCMVTGYTDAAARKVLTPEQVAQSKFLFTNYCHIFPPSTNWDLNLNEPGHPKITYATNVWNLVNCFGEISVLKELNAGNIHRLSNGLTLRVDLHAAFDQLMMWFEEITTNKYLVRSMVDIPDGPTTPITFTTSSELELPDPRYLKLHAVVCRVAHMSGAAEYLDEHDRDMELMLVLAKDGSSAGLLTSCLQRLVPAF